MTCGCQVSVGCSGDQPEFCRETARKARKSHKCSECYREIAKHENYREVTGMWDGVFDRYRICCDCVSVYDELVCNACYGHLWDAVHENIIRENAVPGAECMIALTRVARDKICDMFEEYWGKLEQWEKKCLKKKRENQ